MLKDVCAIYIYIERERERESASLEMELDELAWRAWERRGNGREKMRLD